jgi:hypothetical protein
VTGPARSFRQSRISGEAQGHNQASGLLQARKGRLDESRRHQLGILGRGQHGALLFRAAFLARQVDDIALT